MKAAFNIVEVTDKKTLNDFIRAPAAAQGQDPNWVAPLELMKKEDFSPKHPYFQHAQWQPFVAYQNGRPVGRISAQIDQLYHEHHDASTGFFGLIEGINDPELFQNLTEAAEYWLRDRGMNRILGPFNLGINQEVGLLVEGFDTPPYFLMGHAQPLLRRTPRSPRLSGLPGHARLRVATELRVTQALQTPAAQGRERGCDPPAGSFAQG